MLGSELCLCVQARDPEVAEYYELVSRFIGCPQAGEGGQRAG